MPIKGFFGLSSNRSSVYAFILCAFSFSFPIYTWAGNWCAIALVAFWLIRGFEWKNREHWSKVHWPMLAYFGLHLLALVYTDNMDSGKVDLSSKGALLIAPLLICTIDLSKSQLRRILMCFVAGVLIANLIYIGYASYRYFAEIPIDNPEAPASAVFFYSYLTEPLRSHPAYAASYSLFGLVCLLEVVLDSNRTNKMILGLQTVASLFLWLMVILFVSRMQILAMCALLSVYFLWKFGSRKKWLLAIVAVICTWTITFYTAKAFPYSNMRVENATDNVNLPSNIRFELWDSGFTVGSNEPIMGVGPGDLKGLLVEDYKRKEHAELVELKLNTHSQYIESFAGLGVVGLIAYLLMLLLPTLRAIKHKNAIVFAFFAVFALGTLTECMLEVQRGSIWFGIFASLFWYREDFIHD